MHPAQLLEPTRQSRKLKSIDLPFYTLPQTKKDSAKIIQEARASIRTLDTKRPFTPKDVQRTLFSHTSRPPDSRPPSTFSLSAHDFEKSNTRPKSKPTPNTNEQITKGKDVILPFLQRLPNDPSRTNGKNLRTKLNDIIAPSLPDEPLRQHKIYTRSTEDLSRTDLYGSESKQRAVSGPCKRTIITEQITSRFGLGRRSASLDSPLTIRSDILMPRPESRQSIEKIRQATEGLPISQNTQIKNEVLKEEILYFQELVMPVLTDMDPKLKKEKTPEKLCDASNKLYQVLEDADLLGRNCKQRAVILKTIYKLLDVDSCDLILRLARIILSLKVSGKNLINLMKLIFKVSRNEENDLLFLKDNILDLLLETLKSLHPQHNADALVYGVGALKFLSGNHSLLQELSKLGCVEVLMQPLVQINRMIVEQGEADMQSGNILVQITATLRNLADSPLNRELFLCNRVLPELCKLLEHFSHDADLMLNVSRIFSKLTLYSDCCYELARCVTCYKAFLDLLRKHMKHEDVVIRICFILGNLTAKSEEARSLLFSELQALPTLLTVFKMYYELSNKPIEQNKTPEEQSLQKKTDQDVLIKLIRVIANLCIHPDIGPAIASDESCIKLLLEVLDTYDIMTNEELVLNSIATINNLSFYQVKNSAIMKLQLQIVERLLKLMITDHVEGLIEASRVLGNLTRSHVVRDFLVKRKVDEMMITLLDAGNRELVYTACGVLINLMADQINRPMLQNEGGIRKLIDVLRDFGNSDWQLGSLVCQVLWNYSANVSNSFQAFGQMETHELLELLVDLTEEETAFNVTNMAGLDETMKEIEQELWEKEFCPVATSLLERIEGHLPEEEKTLEYPE